VDFLNKHWGDLASVVGLAVTLYAAAMATRAAAAAQEVKERLSSLDTLADIGSAIDILHEIMRLQRREEWGPVAWNAALDRYSTVRVNLTRSKEAGRLTGEQRKTIEIALQHFRIIMSEIEKATTEDGRQQLDTARFNTVIAREVEHLEAARMAIKKAEA
jgi:hypothetical protein